MSQYFNITSKLTQELIAVGSNISVSKIHLINVQDNFHCKVDLYIEKKLKGKFYLLKEVILSKGENLISSYIKVVPIGSSTPFKR